MKKKIYLQCGYEHKCKKKDCLNCRKKYIDVKLSLAEQVVIENFAIGDLKSLMKNKPELLELMQKIMWKLMWRLNRGKIRKEVRKGYGRSYGY